jgi:hypothetical protein
LRHLEAEYACAANNRKNVNLAREKQKDDSERMKEYFSDILPTKLGNG